MTEITVKDYEVTIKGHANYAEVGKDIVCASVSTLACTLAQNGVLLGDDGFLAECDFKLNDGDVHILMKPTEGYEPLIQAVLSTVLNGFKMLSESYPDYVKYIEE